MAHRNPTLGVYREVLDFKPAAGDPNRHGVRSVISAEFLENIPNVSLSGVLGDFQSVSSDLVGAASGHEL